MISPEKIKKLIKLREMFVDLRFAYDYNGEEEWDDIEEILNELIDDKDHE